MAAAMAAAQAAAAAVPAPPLVDVALLASTPRPSWPPGLLRKVHQRLVAQTPTRDLLARELTTAACTATDWWARHARYGRSLGVASVLGFVLGLGDRHLDNILMDFSSGEVTSALVTRGWRRAALLLKLIQTLIEHVPAETWVGFGE
jgi:hypothetical protein